MNKNGLALLWLALAASFAHADGDYFSPTDDRVRVSLGIMRVSSSTVVQVDSSTGTPGTVINAEDDLGFERPACCLIGWSHGPTPFLDNG